MQIDRHESVPAAGPRRRWVWLAAVLVILALTLLPFSNFRSHAHWAGVVWIPFGDDELHPLDLLGNVALFVPFGLALPGRRQATLLGRLLAAGLSALALSSSIEFAQVFCHNRTASATDVTANVAGAVLGAWLRRSDRSRA